MPKIKQCPCGQTPTNILITDGLQGGKWAWASGGCCSEWAIEFRTQYNALDSEECYKLAVEYWNDAPRAK